MSRKRQALENGAILVLGERTYRINELLSDNGGSCLVYTAERQSNSSYANKVVIKEFYPKSDNVSRYISRGTDNKLVVAEKGMEKFNAGMLRFICGAAKQSAFYENDSNHAMMGYPEIFENVNGSSYSVLHLTKGITINDADRYALSVCDIAQIMISLCNAVKKLHNRGKLYLDVKPDNIFLFNRETNESRRIALFDFDTVADKNNLPPVGFYSEGWSPNEQEFWQADEISEASDIYAIGAVFYWLLTGKRVPEDLSTEILRGNYSFLSRSIVPSDWTDAISDAKKILSVTLSLNSDERTKDITEIIAMFRNLDKNSEASKENEPISEGINKLHKKLDKIGNAEKPQNIFNTTNNGKIENQKVVNIGGDMNGNITL